MEYRARGHCCLPVAGTTLTSSHSRQSVIQPDLSISVLANPECSVFSRPAFHFSPAACIACFKTLHPSSPFFFCSVFLEDLPPAGSRPADCPFLVRERSERLLFSFLLIQQALHSSDNQTQQWASTSTPHTTGTRRGHGQ